VSDLDHHPIRELAAAGVTVTINTDDPPMFGTDPNNEYAIAARLLDLDAGGLTELAIAAVDASFASPESRLRCALRSAPTPRCQLPDRDCRLRSRCL
jgi:aminodeoxyfutalosine deaminase